MDKDVVHIYNRMLLSHKKKNKIMSFAATWMDLLSEVSQRKTNIIWNIYMQNLKYDTNDEFIYERETDSQT